MNIAAWSVRARLTLGFGLVCALMLVIMGVGLASMTRIETGLEQVVDDRVPEMTASYNILKQTGAPGLRRRGHRQRRNCPGQQRPLQPHRAAGQRTGRNQQLPAWKSSAPPSNKMPTAPARPTSWP
jgi:hypothetical protein